jgi:hypothetical protein
MAHILNYTPVYFLSHLSVCAPLVHPHYSCRSYFIVQSPIMLCPLSACAEHRHEPAASLPNMVLALHYGPVRFLSRLAMYAPLVHPHYQCRRPVSAVHLLSFLFDHFRALRSRFVIVVASRPVTSPVPLPHKWKSTIVARCRLPIVPTLSCLSIMAGPLPSPHRTSQWWRHDGPSLLHSVFLYPLIGTYTECYR